jgi:homoserine O-acetyltransferase
MTSSRPPASGAWRVGEPPGERRFALFGPFTTESGFTFPELRVAYQTWGKLLPDRSNALYICHALTGDSHVCGPKGAGHRSSGWWDSIVGPGKPIDTRHWFVVCGNVLGGCQGTTGPASLAPDGRPWGSRFPTITIADMVAVERYLSEALGIPKWACLVGPSLGGMRVLEWLATDPNAAAAAILIGAASALGADQIGSLDAQIAAIQADHGFRGGDYYDAPAGEGPHRGLAVARRIAHLTYRSRIELEERFGRRHQPSENPYDWRNGKSGGRFAITSYLDHQATKLVHRFDANSYIALTQAMSLFDLGRNRGGVLHALSKISLPLTVIGMDSDRLFPLDFQDEISLACPGSSGVEVIRSFHGHDGFLVEIDQLTAIFSRVFSADHLLI